MQIEQALKRIPPGPYKVVHDEARHEWLVCSQLGWPISSSKDPNAARIICHAMNIVGKLLTLLKRYRCHTPLGHQPHMIAAETDDAIKEASEVEGVTV